MIHGKAKNAIHVFEKMIHGAAWANRDVLRLRARIEGISTTKYKVHYFSLDGNLYYNQRTKDKKENGYQYKKETYMDCFLLQFLAIIMVH